MEPGGILLHQFVEQLFSASMPQLFGQRLALAHGRIPSLNQLTIQKPRNIITSVQ
jgi:hypothetical protein